MHTYVHTVVGVHKYQMSAVHIQNYNIRTYG